MKEKENEKSAHEHILEVIKDVTADVSSCPMTKEEHGIDEWSCNECEDFPKHFKFACESISVLCGILYNLIASNPELDLGDMREDSKQIGDVLDKLNQIGSNRMYI